MASAAKIGQLVQANNNFGLDLLRSLSSSLGGGTEGNLFISPVSVSAALSMCLLGARGNTAKEMKKTMKMEDFEDEDIHSCFSEMISGMGEEGLPYTLRAANRLYSRKDYKFLDEFIQATKKYYLAEATEADFAGNAEGARADINKWVEGETANKITDLLPPGSINELTALALVNAVYFKGQWENKFDTRGTHSRAFCISAKETVDTDYMFNSRHFNYTKSTELDCRVLEIPYTNKELSFYVLLPNEREGLKDLESKLTCEALYHLKSNMKSTKIEALIPKFRMEYSASLNEKLGEMGIKDLFSAGMADLSGMDGGNQLAVSSAVHKSFIEVNEEGSEAAAASGISVELVSLEDVNEFIAQHPFLYMIIDMSGVVLFIGRYCHPWTTHNSR